MAQDTKTELHPLHRLLASSEPLRGLLTRVRQNKALTDQVKALLPTDLAPHLAAALMQDGRLVLFSHSPIWASRLRFAVPRLCEGLAEIIEVRIKVLPEISAKPNTQRRPRRARNISPQTAEQIRVVAAAISSDPGLSAALRHLATRSEERMNPASPQETGTGCM